MYTRKINEISWKTKYTDYKLQENGATPKGWDKAIGTFLS